MQILLDGKNIYAYAPKIEFGTYDEPIEKWGMFDENGNILYYAIDHGFALVENVELPSDYADGKYFYENGGFVLNENWQPPLPPAEVRIAQLEETVAMHEENDAELLYQICLLQLGITEDALSGKEV